MLPSATPVTLQCLSSIFSTVAVPVALDVNVTSGVVACAGVVDKATSMLPPSATETVFSLNSSPVIVLVERLSQRLLRCRIANIDTY